MRIFLAALVVALVITSGPAMADEAFGGISVLDGYQVRQGVAVDASSWTIEKLDGLRIHFEAGFSEGLAVNLKDRNKYAWYREQTIRGHKILLALVKPGVAIDADLDTERGLPPGNILMVTFPLPGGTAHAANFIGKVANSEEMADMLLMVLTFDPDLLP